MGWTDEQNKAINDSGNILVSAAAGSGKTAVLTARIVRLVSEGTDISNILVLTFTNAAAAEMKRRIEKNLYDMVDTLDDGDKKRRYYYEQAQKASSASISTNHAFCMRMLRHYFYEVGLSPAFRPIDAVKAETEKKRILHDIMEAAFSGELECEDGQTLDKARAEELFFAFNGERNIMEIIFELSDKMDNRVNGTEWLDEAISHYDVTAENIFSSYAALELEKYIKDKLSLCVDALKVAEMVADDNEKNVEKLNTEKQTLVDIMKADNVQQMHELMKNRGLSTSRFTKDVDPIVPCIRKNVKSTTDTLKKMCEELQFPVEAKNMRELYAQLLTLRELVLAFRHVYAEFKLENDLLDFTDMEHMTLKLLSEKPDILERCKEKYKYIFVDEYQDINSLQNELIHKIACGDNVFLVGDVKQSIYRFREADPSLFIGVSKNYSDETVGRLITLGDNFRSSTAVVDFVNLVFSRLLTVRTGEIDYAKDGMLKKSGNAGEGKAELCLLKVPSTTEDDSEEISNAKIQARFVAKRIRHMLDNEEYFDPSIGKNRQYCCSDFAILMRSRTSMQEFIMELMLEGIPVTAKTNGGYFDALEVKVFLSLLQIIDNRRQDIPLLSVMRSEIGGFTMEEIARIGSIKSEIDVDAPSIYARLCTAAESDEDYALKAKNLHLLLDKWHFESEVLSVEEFIVYLLEETRYASCVRALPGGKQRVLNLMYLRETAHNFEENNGRGLCSFLVYLENVKQLKKDQLAERYEVVSDTVQLMTIHGSKGLEFNVTIIPMLEHSIHGGGARNSALDMQMGNEMGFGMKFVNKNYVYCSTLMHDIIAKKEEDKEIADELRLLYVALTRAKDRLCLVGGVKESKSKGISDRILEAKFLSNTAAFSTIEAKSYLEWLLLALMGSKYSVALESVADGGSCNADNFTFCVAEAETRAETESNLIDSLDELSASASRVDIAAVDDMITREYHAKGDMGVPSKTSVTGIAGFGVHIEDAPSFAIDVKAKKLTATERGTAMHKVLEKIPFCRYSESELASAVEKLADDGLISQQEKECVLQGIGNLTAFFASELGERLMAASKVYREKHFMCSMEACDVFETESHELVMLQGIIDCCFIEDDAWVIVDYKTDSVGHMSYDEVVMHAKKHHEKQVSLYAASMEKITGRIVKEKYIYFLQFGLIRL